MCMCSLLNGLISVVECLLENGAVLRSVSRFELLKEREREKKKDGQVMFLSKRFV